MKKSERSIAVLVFAAIAELLKNKKLAVKATGAYVNSIKHIMKK